MRKKDKKELRFPHGGPPARAREKLSHITLCHTQSRDDASVSAKYQRIRLGTNLLFTFTPH
jgi:hypothetical protein